MKNELQPLAGALFHYGDPYGNRITKILGRGRLLLVRGQKGGYKTGVFIQR